MQDNKVLPVEKFDIKETQEFYKFLCKLLSAVDKSLNDDKINFADVFNFNQVLPTIKPAFEGIRKMPLELSDLSDSEVEALDVTVGEELELSNSEIEIISTSLNRGALEIAQCLFHLRAIRASRTIQE